MIEKYNERLSLYGKDGFRCCPIDKEDEFEVQKIFSEDDCYYFSRDENGQLWLNWE